MNENEWLADRFEAERSHLRGVAYRMLGSLSEADDAVQESWLRLSRSDADSVDHLRGWLTPGGARVSRAMVRARKSRGEEALEATAPEPAGKAAHAADPEAEAMLADSVGYAT